MASSSQQAGSCALAREQLTKSDAANFSLLHSWADRMHKFTQASLELSCAMHSGADGGGFYIGKAAAPGSSDPVCAGVCPQIVRKRGKIDKCDSELPTGLFPHSLGLKSVDIASAVATKGNHGFSRLTSTGSGHGICRGKSKQSDKTGYRVVPREVTVFQNRIKMAMKGRLTPGA